jgi:hypothetical protein
VDTKQAAIADEAAGIGQTLAGEVGKLFSGSAGGGVREREETRERFKTVASVGRLTSARWDPIVALGLQLGRIVLENDRIRLPKPETKPNPLAAPVTVDVDAMEPADVIEQARWMLAELSDDQARDALRAAGVPTLDGCPPELARRLLTTLRARAAGGAA